MMPKILRSLIKSDFRGKTWNDWARVGSKLENCTFYDYVSTRPHHYAWRSGIKIQERIRQALSEFDGETKQKRRNNIEANRTVTDI